MPNTANIPKIFTTVYEKLLEKELNIGKVASRKFDSAVKAYGDTVNVPIGFDPTVTAWTGGAVASYEEISSTSVEIKIDSGDSFNFGLEKEDEVQVAGSENLVNQSIARAIYKMRDNMDSDLGGLYVDAGIIANSGSTVTVTEANAYELLQELTILFDEANVPPTMRTAVLPPRYVGFLSVAIKDAYTSDDALKLFGKNYMGNAAGWNIIKSNNVNNNGTVYNPMFLEAGQTFALAVQQNPKVVQYMPETKVSQAYKAVTMYGVKTYRGDKLGTVPVQFSSLLT